MHLVVWPPNRSQLPFQRVASVPFSFLPNPPCGSVSDLQIDGMSHPNRAMPVPQVLPGVGSGHAVRVPQLVGSLGRLLCAWPCWATQEGEHREEFRRSVPVHYDLQGRGHSTWGLRSSQGRELHDLDAIGSFDAPVVTQDDQGKAYINKDEASTRDGAWKGVAAGALVGLLFPPASSHQPRLVVAAGGVAGHLWKGIFRSDIRELGEPINEGKAALVVFGGGTVSEVLEKAELTAVKCIRR